MEITLRNLQDNYVHLVKQVINYGRQVTVRDLMTYELTNVTLIFPDTFAPMLPIGVGRAVNPRFAAVEALSLIGGVARSDLLSLAAPSYERVLVDSRDKDYGAYGPRVDSQLPEIIELLRHDPMTRQAVMTIWNERDLTHKGDKPCTLTLQFLIRDNQLELHTTMRSQDVWLGVTYDIFMFTQLQHTMARELGLHAGQYVHHVTSLHLYGYDMPVVERLHAIQPNDMNVISHLKRLPHGVKADAHCTDKLSGFDVAEYLLSYDERGGWSASEEERALNPWYADQVAKVIRAKV